MHAEPWRSGGGGSPGGTSLWGVFPSLPPINSPRGSQACEQQRALEPQREPPPPPCVHSETAASKSRSAQIAARPKRTRKAHRMDLDLFADVFY